MCVSSQSEGVTQSILTLEHRFGNVVGSRIQGAGVKDRVGSRRTRGRRDGAGPRGGLLLLTSDALRDQCSHLSKQF